MSATVDRLLKCVGIERVVFVDDAFGTPTADGALDLLLKIPADDRAEILGISSEAAAEPDLLRAELERQLADDADAGALQVALRPIVATGDKSAFPLEELLAPVAFSGLGLDDWRSKRRQLVAESAATPTLVLFDRDFRAEGGDEQTGDKLLAELESDAQALEPRHLWCGLLTQAANEGDEQSLRAEILAETGASSSRLVVIAKDALADEQRFTERLRTMLLAPLLAELMETVSKKIVDTHGAATKEAASLSAEELEAVVFRSSRAEGVWEPDTLVRVFTLLQRDGARRSIREDERVHELTQEIRCLGDALPQPAGIEGDSSSEAEGERTAPAAAPLSSAWKLQRREIYETAEQTNGLHLPLELGDLFERTSTGRQFVLVVQPCHLMVREGGARAPELSHMLLVEIGEGSGDDRYDSFELPYFDAETGASAHARLKRPAFVRTHVLDFCVLNEDGRSRLRADSASSPRLLPTWRERHRMLLNLVVSAGTRDTAVRSIPANSVAAQTIEATRKYSAGGWKEDPFRVDLASMPDELAYDCRRIGRLCEPYASALLTRLHDYLARDAYLHDLGIE